MGAGAGLYVLRPAPRAERVVASTELAGVPGSLLLALIACCLHGCNFCLQHSPRRSNPSIHLS
jgi:hypothetical protein